MKKESVSSLKKNCENCSVEFAYLKKTRRFCTQKCRDAFAYKLKPKTERLRGFKDNCALKGCTGTIWRFPREIKTERKKYCDQVCASRQLQTNTARECSECNSVYYCSKSQVKYRNRITCSIVCRGKRQERIAEERRISNPPTIGVLNRRIRYSKRMDNWRKAIFERDNYTCQFCKVRGGYLEADHIKPFAYFEELRFELINGRTLCKQCHKQTDTYGRRAHAYKKA